MTMLAMTQITMSACVQIQNGDTSSSYETGWLGTGPDAALVALHRPAGPPGDVAVLLCSPFGWEDMCSYRAQRDWAIALAAAGHPTLRLDLPGAGDSAGTPRDPARVAAWTTALDEAAAWLRARTGCGRVAAVGIGLGGVLATAAVARGAAIDDLALWAVPAKGRRLVRELRAFARLEVAAAAPDRTPDDDGALDVAGYVLSAATLADLEALDLAAAPLPHAARRHVLLLGRDGREPDEALGAALRTAGATVQTGAGDGYAQMFMAEPQDSRPAWRTLTEIRAWLGGLPAAASAAPSPDATGIAANDRLELEVDGAPVRETAVLLEHDFGTRVGILCEPAGDTEREDLCLVLLNAGPQRRIGPNRMWVELARRWAARGVTSLRVDLAGIGDAGGDGTRFDDVRTFYDPRYVDQARTTIEALAARGAGPRFVVAGLCVGGWWALEALLGDRRVTAAVGVNTGAVTYDGGWGRTVFEATVLWRKALRPSTWRRVLRGQTSFRVHVRTLRRLLLGAASASLRRLRRRAAAPAPAAGPAAADPVDAVLDELTARQGRLDLIFAGAEPLYDRLRDDGVLARLDRWPGVAVHHVDVDAQVHTLRPLWLQRAVHARLDDLLARELRTARQTRRTTAPRATE